MGRRAPGRTIGLRVDPGAGAGYHAGLEYSGGRPTKFGIGEDRLERCARLGPTPRPDRRPGPLPRRIGLARRRAAGLRGRPRLGGPDDRAADRRGLPDRRGERRRRSGHSRAGGRAGDRSGCLRPGDRPASRPARGGRGRRAGRLPHQGHGDPARRGGHDRGAAGDHLRRAGPRLEHRLLVLHLSVRPGAGGLPDGRRVPDRDRHGGRSHQRGGRHLRRGLPDGRRWPRGTSWRSSTPAGTSRR